MKMQSKATQQKGFTIIELVVVILLLGILAATALPRFMDVTDEAHESVIEGVQGGLSTGIGLFRAQWVGKGQPTAVAVAEFGLGNLFANSNGYPVGTAAGTLPADSAACVTIYDGLLQGGRPVAAATASADRDGLAAVASTNDIAAFFSTPNCVYYYIAQNRPAATGPAMNIPNIVVNMQTGEVSRGVALALAANP